MKPVLYSPGETQFSTNGLGILTDAISCLVTEERNGAFEMEMTYPVSGIHYQEIAARCLITAKPSPTRDPEPFRIYRITKPMGGIVTVYAEHISYDLAGIPVSPFAAGSAAEAMTKLKTSSAVTNPFTFWTDKETNATMKVTTPAALRSLLGGREGSVLDVYGGEYAWDHYTVRLYNQRGQNRGVSIRYGKNLTDLTQDENIAGVYTGVYPYWADMDGNLVELPEKIVPAPGTYDFTRILTLDISSEFETAPTADQLRARTDSYIKANNIGVPKVSIEVSFVPLEQTEEYKDLALLERVDLCDTVNVEFPALGVSATAKCVRTAFDVLLDRYKSVELGDARTSIAETIAAQQQKIEQVPTMSALQQAVDSATSQITGNKGGYVLLHSSTGDKTPDEILIMDTPNIATATKVWRWNKSGLGYSSTGYNGPYGLAMTQNGVIVADFITAGTLSANLIKSGVLQSQNGMTSMDLESGNIMIETDKNTHMFLYSKGIAFYDESDTTAPFGTNIIASFGVADNGKCELLLFNKVNARSYNIAGAFMTQEDGKSIIQAHNGEINVLITHFIETDGVFINGENGENAMGIYLEDDGKPTLLAPGNINIPYGMSTKRALYIEDENGAIIGDFGLTTSGKSRIDANIGVFDDISVQRINGKVPDFSGGGGGSDGNLTVSSLSAGSVDTDDLRVAGLSFSPENITDRNGQTWTVLAIAGRN